MKKKVITTKFFFMRKNKNTNQNEVIITGKWQLAKASENNIKLEVNRL
ncbi:MAG: hypothetical protein ACJA1D_001777 [Polaribacter sp.]|jgi:hypothetical protein